MSESKHVVAIVGGAVSGSVAAEILADAGVEVVVIEQNDRPYGKIEDGLPRWHAIQRRKEYEKIDARLSRPDVHFVPHTKLGRDISFNELAHEFGFSAVLLANGAWRDRPLGLEGSDEFVGKGLEYQNPFIYWFNHKNEQDFHSDHRIHIPQGPVVVGGGLASIDVIKVCQLQLYRDALAKHGKDVRMVHLEKEGVPHACKSVGIDDPAELGVKDALLIYRRRCEDMPLGPEKARKILLDRAQEKYHFRVQDKTLPTELLTKDGRVTGLRTVRTEVDGRKATPIEGTEEIIETEFIVSSIGSVPEKIEGIAMSGEWYTWKDWDLGHYEGLDNVFGVGNVVTGQGNIRKSLLHAQAVAEHLKDNYFRGALGAAQAEAVKEHVATKEKLPVETVKSILARVKARQDAVGYHDGGFAEWIKQVTPPDLE
ncbi:MAG: FAD-dependent oxidoreductase [Planctomycetota bacterium]|jgi:NADPH-dependent glutamate synthase beta subunit-like oxidoreductase